VADGSKTKGTDGEERGAGTDGGEERGKGD
jgi:hypothetical protein